MKIQNNTIINGESITEQAVDYLFDTALSDVTPSWRYTGEKIDYADFKGDIIVDDEGVHAPTYYDNVDDCFKPVGDYSLAFTREQLQQAVLDIIREDHQSLIFLLRL